jgi:hypothetical protein
MRWRSWRERSSSGSRSLGYALQALAHWAVVMDRDLRRAAATRGSDAGQISKRATTDPRFAYRFSSRIG